MTNSNKQFSTGEALSFGWNTYKANLGLLIGALIIFVLIIGAVDYLLFLIFPTPSDTGFSFDISGLIGFIVNTFLCLGMIKIVLALHDKKKTAIGDLFSCANLLIAGVVAGFLYTLMVGIGLVLLVGPGIFLAIMFQFHGLLIVDKGVGPMLALKDCKKLTSEAKSNLFRFDLALFGFNLAGLLCLVVGLFVTGPISLIAITYVYRKLLSFEEETKEEVPETSSEEAPKD